MQSYLNRPTEFSHMDREDLIRIVEDLHNQLDEVIVILENINDGIYLTDGKAHTIFLNKAYEKMSGTPRNKFIGKSMYQIVEEGLIDSSGTIMVLENQKEVTIEQTLNNGCLALITSTPIYNEEGEIILVVTVLRDITELSRLQEEVAHREKEIIQLKKYMESRKKVIYNSKVMESVLARAQRVARYDSTVLLTGETGAGKDVISRFIYENSSRSDNDFFVINCSTIPKTLIESEFFGYEKGAFTGAVKTGKKGIFERADGGTVFLDEIGELPLDMQASLLHVLQDKIVRRVGGTQNIDVDVRIVAATNRNLQEMVEEGSFREDLYYRLNVISIEIPPLRQRKEDIFPLIDHFMNFFNLRYGMHKHFAENTLQALYEYDWPGNVRELRNFIERVFILSPNDIIYKEELPVALQSKGEQFIIENENMTLPEARSRIESLLIEKAFMKYRNVTDAAKALDIDPSTFVRKRKKYIDEGFLSEKKFEKKQ